MKCIKFPSIVGGFPVIDGMVMVGEEGRGRSAVYIPVLNTPNIERLEHAKIGKSGKNIVLHSIDEDNDDKILAIIDTAPSYDRYRNFEMKNPMNVEVLAEGYKAFGQAGRVNGGPVYLAILNQGWSFGVTEKYRDIYFSEEDGEVRQYTTAQWKVRELKNLSEEEIEWL